LRCRAFDTGAWVSVPAGLEDDLSYHELVTGFLQELCFPHRCGRFYCEPRSTSSSYLHIRRKLTQ